MRDLVLRATGSAILLVALAITISVASHVSFRLPMLPEGTSTTGPIEISEEKQVALPSPTAEDFSVITDRPLFSETRRPKARRAEVAVAAPSTAKSPLPVSKPPQVQLLGIMAGGKKPRALIVVDGGPAIWVTEGEEFETWSVTKTGEDWLVITFGEQDIRLDLYE